MSPHEPDASPRQSGVQHGGITDPGVSVARGVARGLFGGLIATAVMTAYRFPVFRALAPTADFWAKYVAGGEPEAYPGMGLVLHFLYGGVAGALFGAGTSLLHFRREGEGGRAVIGLAFAYGLALSLFGTRVLFHHLLEEDLDPSEAMVFHLGHVIYGLTLGTWMHSRERSGEVYE